MEILSLFPFPRQINQDKAARSADEVSYCRYFTVFFSLSILALAHSLLFARGLEISVRSLAIRYPCNSKIDDSSEARAMVIPA